MPAVPTIKVKDDKAEGGFRVINADDFDPKTDTEFKEPKAAAPKKEK